MALGETHRVYGAKNLRKPPVGYHSIMGVGKMKPSEEGVKDFNNSQNDYAYDDLSYNKNTLRFDTGSIIPSDELLLPGNVELNSELLYNEYIVYDVAQVS